jgi:hypothetical protein
MMAHAAGRLRQEDIEFETSMRIQQDPISKNIFFKLKLHVSIIIQIALFCICQSLLFCIHYYFSGIILELAKFLDSQCQWRRPGNKVCSDS